MSNTAILDAAPLNLPEIADQFATEVRAAQNAARSKVEHARRAGELLRTAKAALPHGEWMPWLTERARQCGISVRTAEAYMRLAKRWDVLEKRNDVANMPVREAMRLVSTPRTAHDDRDADAVGQQPERAPVSDVGLGALPAARYMEDGISVFHADARDVMPTMSPERLIVCDPPYNIGLKYDGHDDRLPQNEYEALLQRVLRPPAVVVHLPERLPMLARLLGMDPTKVVAWVYPTNLPGGFRAVAWFGCKPVLSRLTQPYRNPNDKRIRERLLAGHAARSYAWWKIAQVKNVSAEKTSHPCQTPEELMRRILIVSAPTLVVDPFAGSGTTLIAAKRLRIPATGIEKSRTYCDIAIERLRREKT